jgi:hypothetical protein
MVRNPSGEKQVSAELREAILERDQYRCRVCGAKAPEIGGHTPLHVHHIEDDPDHCDLDDKANLTTLCKLDHNLYHDRQKRADVSTELSDAAAGGRLEQDYEILKILEDEGPLSVAQLSTRLGDRFARQVIRDRLWKLMALDLTVGSQDQQVADKDAITDKWGMPADISTSERGRIPDDNRELARRIEDERIRRALARGVDRSTVAESFGVAERTTWYKQHRAQAFAFPLDEVNTRGRTPIATEAATGQAETVPETTNNPDPRASPPSTDSVSELSQTQPLNRDGEPDNGDIPTDDHVGTQDTDPDETTPNDPVVNDDNEDDTVAENTAEADSSSGEAIDTIDAPVELLDEADPATPNPEQPREELEADDDRDYHRLLMTVGLDDLKTDALLRHCIEQGKSLDKVLEEEIQQFIARVREE